MASTPPYVHHLADAFYPSPEEAAQIRAQIVESKEQAEKVQSEIEYYELIIENFRRGQFEDTTIRRFLERNEAAQLELYRRLEKLNFATQAGHGLFAPIRRLPWEVLQQVFHYSMPSREERRKAFYRKTEGYWDASSLRLVCRLWNRVYVGSSEFCTSITFTPRDESHDMVDQALQRSGNRDIDLFIRPIPEGANYAQLLTLFAAHKHRIVGISHSYRAERPEPVTNVAGTDGDQVDGMAEQEASIEHNQVLGDDQPLLGQVGIVHGLGQQQDNLDFWLNGLYDNEGFGLDPQIPDMVDSDDDLWGMHGQDGNGNGNGDGDGDEGADPPQPASFLGSLLHPSSEHLQYLCLKGDTLPFNTRFHLPNLTELVLALAYKQSPPWFSAATLNNIRKARLQPSGYNTYRRHCVLLTMMHKLETLTWCESSHKPFHVPLAGVHMIHLPNLTDFVVEYRTTDDLRRPFPCPLRMKSLRRFSLIKLPATKILIPPRRNPSVVPEELPYQYLDEMFEHHFVTNFTVDVDTDDEDDTHFLVGGWHDPLDLMPGTDVESDDGSDMYNDMDGHSEANDHVINNNGANDSNNHNNGDTNDTTPVGRAEPLQLTFHNFLLDYYSISKLMLITPSRCVSSLVFKDCLVAPSFYEEFMGPGYHELLHTPNPATICDVVFKNSVWWMGEMPGVKKPVRLGYLRDLMKGVRGEFIRQKGPNIENEEGEDIGMEVLDCLVRFEEVTLRKTGNVTGMGMEVVDAVWVPGSEV